MESKVDTTEIVEKAAEEVMDTYDVIDMLPEEKVKFGWPWIIAGATIVAVATGIGIVINKKVVSKNQTKEVADEVNPLHMIEDEPLNDEETEEK